MNSSSRTGTSRRRAMNLSLRRKNFRLRALSLLTTENTKEI